jgi:hypothetical protein
MPPGHVIRHHAVRVIRGTRLDHAKQVRTGHPCGAETAGMGRMSATTNRTADRQRVAGIDRRTIGPALLVLALAVLMSVVLPSIDNDTPYREAVHKGDVVEIADGITLVPAAGWHLASGVLAGRTRTPAGSTGTTELVDGGVDFDVQAAPFAGTPSALLGQVNKINADLAHARGSTATTSDRYAVTTRQGVGGVAEDFAGVEKQGSIVAFVFRSRAESTGQSTREGVEIVVSGPRGAISRRRDAVVAMIRSLRTAP